jgi:hypothetical protein
LKNNANQYSITAPPYYKYRAPRFCACPAVGQYQKRWSLGHNLPLSPAAFCSGTEYEAKIQEWKDMNGIE